MTDVQEIKVDDKMAEVDTDMNASNEGAPPIEDELDTLKKRATLMGIQFHPSIGIVKLREKVNAKLNSDDEVAEPAAVVAKPTIRPSRAQLKAQYHTRLRKEANRLIRIRLTCMNPNKKDWPGEIFSVSNSVIGTVKKFVPYQDAEDGYHVPHVIYEQLIDRKYQQFRKVKLPNGGEQMKGSLVKEFSIEVLPRLTSTELKDLATKQALNHSID